MSDIHVPENRSYALNDVVDAVKQTLDAINEQSVESELQYSSKDLYWLLHDMIRYVNRNIPGEFVLYQTRRGVYRVRYTAEDSARRRSSQKLKVEVNRTATYLEELTGRRPPWGDKEE